MHSCLNPSKCTCFCTLPHRGHCFMLSLRICRPGVAASTPRCRTALTPLLQHHMSCSNTAPAGQQQQQPAAVGQQQQQQPVPAADTQAADPIVQWVVLRRDLWQDLGWPLGAVVAQACHASTAAVFSHLSDELTQQYMQPDNIDHMHKVVLEIKSEQQLVNLSSKLQQEGIQHKLWVEQPENFPTCLATKPYLKSQAAAHFKKLQLCKAVVGAKS